MFVALWEYEVKRGSEEKFEKVYGPAGEWARLFQKDLDYRETRLLRDVLRPEIYVTLDSWNSRSTYEEFMAANHAEYKRIDALGESLTIRERRIGWYELVQE